MKMKPVIYLYGQVVVGAMIVLEIIFILILSVPLKVFPHYSTYLFNFLTPLLILSLIGLCVLHYLYVKKSNERFTSLSEIQWFVYTFGFICINAIVIIAACIWPAVASLDMRITNRSDTDIYIDNIRYTDNISPSFIFPGNTVKNIRLRPDQRMNFVDYFGYYRSYFGFYPRLYIDYRTKVDAKPVTVYCDLSSTDYTDFHDRSCTYLYTKPQVISCGCN